MRNHSLYTFYQQRSHHMQNSKSIIGVEGGMDHATWLRSRLVTPHFEAEGGEWSLSLNTWAGAHPTELDLARMKPYHDSCHALWHAHRPAFGKLHSESGQGPHGRLALTDQGAPHCPVPWTQASLASPQEPQIQPRAAELSFFSAGHHSPCPLVLCYCHGQPGADTQASLLFPPSRPRLHHYCQPPPLFPLPGALPSAGGRSSSHP
jgi:hypothetical protein